MTVPPVTVLHAVVTHKARLDSMLAPIPTAQFVARDGSMMPVHGAPCPKLNGQNKGQRRTVSKRRRRFCFIFDREKYGRKVAEKEEKSDEILLRYGDIQNG